MAWDAEATQAFMRALRRILAERLGVDKKRLSFKVLNPNFDMLNGGGSFKPEITLDGAPLTPEQKAVFDGIMADDDLHINLDDEPLDELSN